MFRSWTTGWMFASRANGPSVTATALMRSLMRRSMAAICGPGAVHRVEAGRNLEANLVWEHFSEDDDRLRSGKQLCKTAQAPTSIQRRSGTTRNLSARVGALQLDADYLSQGCEAMSLYSPDAFEVPYGFSLPYASHWASSGVANAYHQSLCKRHAIAQFARDRIDDQSPLSSEKRYGRTERRLRRYAIADLHIADRI